MPQGSIATSLPLTCPICGCTPKDGLFYSSPDWAVPQCSGCTFAWVEDISPRPESTSFDWDEGLSGVDATNAAVATAFAASAHDPQPKRWLDVGVGGGLLGAPRKRIRRPGLELSPSGARVARELNITVHNRPLDITCRNSVIAIRRHQLLPRLEHVIDPLHGLNTAQLRARRSAAGGSAAFRFALMEDRGRWHRHFYRGHRSYFNDALFRRFCARRNSTSCRCRPGSLTTPPSTGSWRVPALRLARSSAKALHLDQVAIRDLGDMFLIIAKRSDAATANG
jgi:hypothetical protein